MSDNVSKRGRPSKPEGERMSQFLSVRFRADQAEALRVIARRQGFSESGGMSAAVRWCVDKMAALVTKEEAK